MRGITASLPFPVTYPAPGPQCIPLETFGLCKNSVRAGLDQPSTSPSHSLPNSLSARILKFLSCSPTAVAAHSLQENAQTAQPRKGKPELTFFEAQTVPCAGLGLRIRYLISFQEEHHCFLMAIRGLRKRGAASQKVTLV